jgi:hypothetical protein
MMRKLTFIISILSFLIIPNLQAQTAAGLLSKMLDAINNCRTSKYVADVVERIDGKLAASEMIIKVKNNPFSVYTYSINPDPGAEALFVRGENSNELLVNPKKFPYVNINMSPFNSLIRKGHHHTIYEVGFGFMGEVISYNINHREKEFYEGLTYDGEADYKGKSYYKLSINNPSFGYIDYTVQQGENLYIIGRKFYVSDYMILSINKNMNDFNDVKPGQVIKIPSTYAKKFELYIDKTNYLPVVQIIYDDKGLFGQYEYNSLIVNPVFAPDEFTSKFKDYKF